MKKFITLLILLCANIVFASTQAELSLAIPKTESSVANLNKGNMQIGGGFYWSQNSGSSDSSTISVWIESFSSDDLGARYRP
ncbi:MAG: hypothetical protein ACXWRU_18135 [Pseudobdellovibrionaceae bacterium]